MSELVRAAGGIPWRIANGVVEVLVAHRPAYDDWTFPKGKAKREERDEDCALREVEEETGLRCELGHELASAEYRDSKGRPKRVRYWALTCQDNARPSREVDRVEWLTPDRAASALSYERDREVLASFVELVADSH